MSYSTNIALALAGLSMSAGLFLLLLFVILGFTTILVYWFFTIFSGQKTKKQSHKITVQLIRSEKNPILAPVPEHAWEAEAVFNPAAVVEGERVHLFYRALGPEGISRIGYASSLDGIHFDTRLPYPVYDLGAGALPTHMSPYRPLSYNTDIYASGGGWGGTEDPRAITMDNHVYMSFGIFESWQSMRMAVTALSFENLRLCNFAWLPHITMSPKMQTHKNWVLFPEKINGKYAILHALTPGITIDYIDALEDLRENPIESNNKRSGREGAWDAFVRGAASPPMKTKEGWLLLYHGMSPKEPHIGYKVGAMLLDLEDPTKILHRSNTPILEPKEWYENDWKPGVVYASGAVIFKDELIVYYGGGDKFIAAATAPLDSFLHSLCNNTPLELHSAGTILKD